MSSRFNTLYHGSASQAADILDHGGDLTSLQGLVELRAALTNALRRIAVLEKALADMRKDI